jgi:hypothetical protein
MRISREIIHVKSYELKVSIIGEVGLELVADSNHCVCPKLALRICFHILIVEGREKLTHTHIPEHVRV